MEDKIEETQENLDAQHQLLQSKEIADNVKNLETPLEGMLLKSEEISKKTDEGNESLKTIAENTKPKEVQKIESDKLDAIAENTKPKEVQKIELVNDDKELAGKFFSLLRGEKGDKGEKGEKGEKGDKGDKPNESDLISIIKPLIPEPKDGKDGKNGKDGKDGKNGKDGKDGSPDTPKQVKEKLLKVGLDYEELNGLPDIPKIVSIYSKTSSRDYNLSELKDVSLSSPTNNQVLKYNSTTRLWENGAGGGSSPLTSKGDIYTFSTVDARLPVGTNGQVLSADSSTATGLKWVALAGGGDMLQSTYDPAGVSEQLVGRTAIQTLTNKTLTSPTINAGTFGTSITASYATVSTVPYFDASKNLISSAVTPTELGYLSGVTSAIQTQLNAKQGLDTQLTSVAALSYTGNALKVIRVNAGETDFELATISAGGGDVYLANNQTFTGVNTFTPTARSSGVASYFTITTPADTGITLNTESKGINIIGGTRTWADGTVSTQREYFFGKPTYNKTTTSTTFTDAYTLYIEGSPTAGTGVTITKPWALGVGGNIYQNGRYTLLGDTTPNNTTLLTGTSVGTELWGNNNTISGVQMGVGNTSNGTSAYSFYFLNSDLAVSNDSTHYAGIGLNSSGYNDNTFGTGANVANQFQIWNTDGPITSIASKNGVAGYFNWLVRGSATTNEMMKLTNTELTVGLAGTTTGKVRFAGATSNYIDVVGVAVGGSTTNTLQAVTDTFVYRTTTDTLTNKRITKRVVTAADATSVTPNSDNADWTYQSNTQATGTLTINADSGTPTDGQSWGFRIKSTNVQTFSWNSVFIGGTTALPTASTGSSKIDMFTFIYSTVNSKWMYTGSAGGF